MTDAAGGRERSLINLYGMRKGDPRCSLPDKVSLELIVVPRSRNTKRIPSQTARTVVRVSEDCTTEAVDKG